MPRDLKVLAHNAEAAIEHDLSADSSLIPLRQDQQRRRRDRTKFMVDHDLSRDAVYPASRVWHFGLVAVVIAAEAALNCGFFAGANQLGLVGGLLAAIGVALINAVLGLLSGYFPFRWRHHLEPRLRRLAAVGVALSFVLIVVFNWAVARYRDVAAARVAQVRIADLLHPSTAMSLESLALFMLGTLAAMFCARKAYTADDRVPEFGQQDRDFRAADHAFLGHRDSLQRRVMRHAEEVPEVCRSLTRGAEDALRQLGQIVVRAQRALEAYEAERERISRWCLQYLRRYRAENEAVRTTAAPKYFSEYPEFPSQITPDQVTELQHRLNRVGTRLVELKEESDRIALEQAHRVATARDRFSMFLRRAMRTADAGRGDGSAHHVDEHEDKEARAL